MSASDESIHQLTETVNALAHALAKSEARYRSIEKIYRWMAAGLVAMAAIVFYIGLDFVTRVYADNPDAQQQIVKAIDDLREQGVPLNLGGTLLNVAALGKMMAMSKTQNAQQPGGQPVAQQSGQQSGQQGNQPQTFQQAWDQTVQVVKKEDAQAVMNDMKALANMELSPCHAPGWRRGPSAGGPPQELQSVPCPPQAIQQPVSLAEAAQDLAILITNLKWDSDWLRLNTNPSQTVTQELARMNGMLAAIPPMALEVRKMNIAMGAMTNAVGAMTGAVGSMTNSVGSTMGRFGSMWPF